MNNRAPKPTCCPLSGQNDSSAEKFELHIMKMSQNRKRLLKLVTLAIIVCSHVQESQQQSAISLNNTPWTLSNANGSIMVPAQVPGGVYSDLRRAGVLKQELLQGKNDMAYRWVGQENWTYTSFFVIDHQIARSQAVKLVLHGIDTIATLYLNGNEVGRTDNMFVRYKFDIKPYLKLAGLDNVLVIKFESPIKYGARKSRESIRNNRGRILPPYCPSPVQRGECHINFIRKMQASFSWDWGPAFPSVGIYKNIELEYGSFGTIRDILVDTKRLAPLVQPHRPPSPPQQVIISSSIKHNVRTPSNDRHVPYMRAPPFYLGVDGSERNRNVAYTPSSDKIDLSNEASQQLMDEYWLLKTTLVAEMVQPSFGYNLRIEFNLNGVLHYESEHFNVIANSDGYIRLGFNLRIDPSRLRVKPWWPNNAGSQTLYKLSARMMPVPNSNGPPEHIRLHASPLAANEARESRDVEDATSLRSRSRPPQSHALPAAAILSTQLDASTYQQQYISAKEISFGFRTVELIQEPVTTGQPEDGLTFHFRVNGVDLFGMGSNWIPSSVLPENSNDFDYIRYLLQSVKDANMNMLRVWGGGLYESDEFYKLADEMGIMIWQDFMFACALYPADEDFLASVRLEVEQQVQRLQYHPSILLWAGNNENEMAIASPWWPEVMMWSKQLREGYAKLYVETIRPIVQILDPTRPYVESSPSNGLLSETQPNSIARTPNDNKYGDVHHYDYLSDSFEWTNFPSTRFASEYGYQSYPSFNALTQVTTLADWKYPLTANILHRQHRLTGEAEMKLQIRMHFGEIPSGGVIQFKNFLYLSQLTQAIAIKTETEFYRRNRFVDGETKLGKTMGALYWQLNDVWPAPTWSSIEYGGKWKILHYFARRFFFPIQVMPYLIQPQTGGLFGGSGGGGSMQQVFSAAGSLMANLTGGRPQAQQQQQDEQQNQQQQPVSGSPVLAVDLVRDDLFHLLDSFNVTIRFYRWTSFAPVWQDTIYVKHTRPQNVTRIYEQELSRIVRHPGVISLSSGVFLVTIEQQPRLGLSQIENYLMPVSPSRITAMRVARITVELVQGPFKVADMRSDAADAEATPPSQVPSSPQWECFYRLTLVSDSIAMFVWLDLNLLNIGQPGTSSADLPSQEQASLTPQRRRPPPPSSSQNIRPPPPTAAHLAAPDKLHLSALPMPFVEVPQAPDHIRIHTDNLQGRSEARPIFPPIPPAASGDRQARFLLRHPRMADLTQSPAPRRFQVPAGPKYRPVDAAGGENLRYQFNDNGFNMFEPSRVIDLYLSKCISRAHVEVALEIQSLADVL